MGSQIERIMFLTERGWYPYEGSVDISVYEQLKCPAPLFAKWLYEGKDALEAACVGCERYCTVDCSTGFKSISKRPQQPYRGHYFSLSPMEMVKRFHVLTVQQAAYCLNVSIRTIYTYVDMAKVTVLKTRPLRIKAKDVYKMMNDFDE